MLPVVKRFKTGFEVVDSTGGYGETTTTTILQQIRSIDATHVAHLIIHRHQRKHEFREFVPMEQVWPMQKRYSIQFEQLKNHFGSLDKAWHETPSGLRYQIIVSQHNGDYYLCCSGISRHRFPSRLHFRVTLPADLGRFCCSSGDPRSKVARWRSPKPLRRENIRRKQGHLQYQRRLWRAFDYQWGELISFHKKNNRIAILVEGWLAETTQYTDQRPYSDAIYLGQRKSDCPSSSILPNLVPLPSRPSDQDLRDYFFRHTRFDSRSLEVSNGGPLQVTELRLFGQSFRVNPLILGAASPVLAAILRYQRNSWFSFGEQYHSNVVLLAVVHYAYLGQLPLWHYSADFPEKMLAAADEYQMWNLKGQLLHFLSTQVTRATATHYYNLAHLYGSPRLANIARRDILTIAMPPLPPPLHFTIDQSPQVSSYENSQIIKRGREEENEEHHCIKYHETPWNVASSATWRY